MKITEILSQFNVPYKKVGEHHHATMGFVQIDCPFCSKDSGKYRMGVSLTASFCSCWVCGHHTLISTLMELLDITYRRCKKLLEDLEIDEAKFERPIGKLVIPKGVRELQPAHRRYLKGRGFNPKELEKVWNVQGIGIAAKLSWRIFIPIYYQGAMASWTTRSLSDSGTRYISASAEQESIPHKELLYGEDYVRHSIIVTEGPFDVWRIGKGAVATLGVIYTQAQMNRMIKYPLRAICFDNSIPAQKRAQNLCNNLSVFPGETYNIQLDSKDLGEASTKEIKRLRKFLK